LERKGYFVLCISLNSIDFFFNIGRPVYCISLVPDTITVFKWGNNIIFGNRKIRICLYAFFPAMEAKMAECADSPHLFYFKEKIFALNFSN